MTAKPLSATARTYLHMLAEEWWRDQGCTCDLSLETKFLANRDNALVGMDRRHGDPACAFYEAA